MFRSEAGNKMVETQEIDLPLKLLQILDKKDSFETLSLSSELSIPHQKLIGAVHSLLTKEGVCLDFNKRFTFNFCFRSSIHQTRRLLNMH